MDRSQDTECCFLSLSLVFDLCVCLFTDIFKYSLLHFTHNLANPEDLLSQLIRKVNVLQIGLKWKISGSLDGIYLRKLLSPAGSVALKNLCCVLSNTENIQPFPVTGIMSTEEMYLLICPLWERLLGFSFNQHLGKKHCFPFAGSFLLFRIKRGGLAGNAEESSGFWILSVIQI